MVSNLLQLGLVCLLAQQSDADADAQWQSSLPIGQIANIQTLRANKPRIGLQVHVLESGLLGSVFRQSSESRLVL